VLAAALAATALVAGIAGAWSPCGFSMVETLGAAPRRTTLAASVAAFAVGALAGGVTTFAGLALAGTLVLPERSWAAIGPVTGIALIAGAAEARGTRIVPQIRRQVPEAWRRTLPLPVAAGAYGVLLGLGFTTFVLTFAFWGLALTMLLLADPRLGLVVGLVFGIGRALPVGAIAPLASRRTGRQVVDTIACRPGILRGVRVAAAITLAFVVAGVLAAGASAEVVARAATDPTVSRGAIAWDGVGRAYLRYDYHPGGGAHHLSPLISPLAGADPAVGGSRLAWREGSVVRVVALADFAPVLELSLPGVDALAVSARWLAYRVRAPGGDRLAARRLAAPAEERTIAAAGARSSLGRPSADGDQVVFHADSGQTSRIVAVRLDTGRTRVVRRSRLDQLTNPAVLGTSLVYVVQSSRAQELVLGRIDRPSSDRVLMRMPSTAAHDSGHQPGYSRVTRTPPAGRRAGAMLWTTALTARAAYVTLLPLRGGVRSSRIVAVAR
jgi:hypothetical protein